MQPAIDLALSPSGRLILVDTSGDIPRPLDRSLENQLEGSWKKTVGAFGRSSAEGLFLLGAELARDLQTPAFSFWRDFAASYLTELCHLPPGEQFELSSVPKPEDSHLMQLFLSLPPMHGAEYLSVRSLSSIWSELNSWIYEQVAGAEGGLSSFLEKHAAHWQQVGRVCFHLAENRQDTDYPFAFLATYAPGFSSGNKVRYQPLGNALQEYAGAKNKRALIRLLSPVERASKDSSLVHELVDSGDIYHPLAWTPKEAYRLLQDAPALNESGVLLRLPNWWKKRPRPKVAVTIGEKNQGKFDAGAMLDFKAELALGDEKLSEEEWQRLLQAEDGLVLLRGEWVEIDKKRLNEALEHWKKLEAEAEEGVSFVEGMRLLAGAAADLGAEKEQDSTREWGFVQAGTWLEDMLSKLRSPENLAGLKLDSELQAVLRPYQETGVRWLEFLSSLGLGACLADDMGLGKTLQVLALLSLHKGKRRKKPSLLVVPASLVGNWKAEMGRFTPKLRCLFAHPSEMPKEELARLASDPSSMLKKHDLVLTTYSMLLRQSWLLEVDWQLVVLDEAQAIKNPAARQTKKVKCLQAQARVALTGTPVENRLSDLWSLFDFLCPGLLGSQQKFGKFIKQLSTRSSEQYAPLRGLIQPYILRRLKTDRSIISDLPEKTEVKAFCGLSKKQAAMYKKLVSELERLLDGVQGIKRRGLVLSYLMRFKQLCNHPSQLSGDGEFAPEGSGKLLRLRQICQEIAVRQEKVLVFTQFREMCSPLAEFLAGVFGREGLVLHGQTAVGKRKKLIDRFQDEEGIPFFILSLKAGGTGLNLTAASHVIHFDRWWNPAVENQATDRAFRIGQKRNVLVHKFVCRGTIEEKIDELIEEKTGLAEELLSGGAEKMLTEMSNHELIRLVQLDIERAGI